MTTETADTRYAPMRVRFEPRRRELTITERAYLSPSMLRLTLTGDMAGFQSLGFDDHIKLFLPDPLTGRLTLPNTLTPEAVEAIKPIMRDYTPRAFDIAKGVLTLDFALHGSENAPGPATAWALTAQPGDTLNVGGPRGSTVIPDVFDHYVLIGDDTALPAIGRRLEELRQGVRITVLAEVETPKDRIELPTRPGTSVHWVYRSEAVRDHPLAEAVQSLPLPSETTHIWAAGEADQARRIKQILIDKGANPARTKVAGYWRKGATGTHEPID